MALRKEIQDVVDEVTGAAHEGEHPLRRILHASVEVVEVAGVLVKSFDETNREVDLAELRKEIELAGGQIVEKILVGRPVMRVAAKSALPGAAASLVAAIDGYAGPVTAFVDEHVLPALKEIEDAARRSRAAFGD